MVLFARGAVPVGRLKSFTRLSDEAAMVQSSALPLSYRPVKSGKQESNLRHLGVCV